jgi:hypothetical protein
MPAARRHHPWILGLAVLMLGLFATLAVLPCPGAHSAASSSSAVSVPERAASGGLSDPCGDTEAYHFTSTPSGGAQVAPARAPEGQAVTAVAADRHRSESWDRAGATIRTSWCVPASLVIADLAVARI